ncbi:MAG TPA: DUF4340 domain-containing protein [Isosphaeraceae bacterium]|jgi:hypothetical protein|nr:DUF4340 domain-containing protein [Isosphaeraceae bacterium]
MNNRFTIALFVVFVAALGLLWYADYAQLPTPDQLKKRDQLVLPELADVKPIDVVRVEIDGGKEPVVLERRDEDAWQLTRPTDALADKMRVDALLGNLRGLRKIGDEPSIQGDPGRYGLAKPARVIRLYTKGSEKPVAALELGDTNQNGRYVRPPGAKGIEVANASLLTAADIPASDWREQRLIPATSFAIKDVTVSKRGRTVLEVGREGTKWRIEKPIRAPADEIKIQGVLGDLTGLHVADGAKGFVADNVKDLARFGLDEPRLTITVREAQQSGNDRSVTVAIGKAVDERADRAFARRTDQDDVVVVDPTPVLELGNRPSSLRSSKLADFDPEMIDHIALRVGKVEHELRRVKEKDRERWEILKPSKAEADPRTVQNLLARLAAVEASDFLDRDKVRDAGLNPPAAEVTLWKADEPKEGEDQDQDKEASRSEAKSAEPAPVFQLTIGRHEAAKKTVLATTPGDPTTLLALPDNILEILPRGPLSFRDRTIVSGLSPTAIDRVVVATKARTTVLEAPAKRPGDFDHWRLTKPVDAPADATLIRLLAQLLSNLRAADFIADKADDPKAFGLDDPFLVVSWQWRPEATASSKASPESTERTLKIGAVVPNTRGSRYAMISGSPAVFAVNPETIRILESDWHEHLVIPKFALDDVARVELRRAGQTIVLAPSGGRTPGGRPEWKVASGELKGIDLGQLNPLLEMMSGLQALRFTQYEGPLPPRAGLSPPRLQVGVDLQGGQGTRLLRIGDAGPEPGTRLAATSSGAEGAVFLLNSGAWENWIEPPGPAKTPAPAPASAKGESGKLPEDVFAPAPH